MLSLLERLMFALDGFSVFCFDKGFANSQRFLVAIDGFSVFGQSFLGFSGILEDFVQKNGRFCGLVKG